MIRLEGKRYARRLASSRKRWLRNRGMTSQAEQLAPFRRLALLRSRAIAATHRHDPIPVVRVKLDSPPAPPRKPSLLARLFGRRGK